MVPESIGLATASTSIQSQNAAMDDRITANPVGSRLTANPPPSPITSAVTTAMIPRTIRPVTKRMAVGDVCFGRTSADFTIETQGMPLGEVESPANPQGGCPSTTSGSSGAPQFRQRIELA